jgi:hypothetical protein
MQAATGTAAPERVVERRWGARGVDVLTVHPQFGLLRRGRVRIARDGAWTWSDYDGNVGRAVGDYLDAEAVLLGVTAALDELDPDFDPNEE